MGKQIENFGPDNLLRTAQGLAILIDRTVISNNEARKFLVDHCGIDLRVLPDGFRAPEIPVVSDDEFMPDDEDPAVGFDVSDEGDE